jgi:uncharacterized protein YecT (DUF1311 family)
MVRLTLALLAGLAVDAGAAKKGPPAEIAGTWDVEAVKVDTEDALHWEVKPDAPHLMGRTLIIDATKVQFGTGKIIGCQQASWPPRKTTWGVLMGKGFPRTTENASPTPSPGDFELKVKKTDAATAFTLCPKQARNALQFPQDHWVVSQAPDQLALHYSNQVLLLLRRRTPEAKPRASFDCAKAASPTEKTICASFDLASWDRSVTLAFKNALERQTPEKTAELKQAQKKWLKERDACGTNTDCIYEHEWQRVDELNWPQ